MQRIADLVVRQAEDIVQSPPLRLEYNKGDSLRKLDSARRVLSAIIRLGIAHHLTDDATFAAGAARQLNETAAEPDWNPELFLTTAETSLAVSLALAWLQEALPSQTREAASMALIEKALRPAWEVPKNGHYWADHQSNWTQVCHGGLVAAALVTASMEPDLSRLTIERAVAAQHACAHIYAPDGAYIEGPGYWGFGTSYAVFLIDFLEKNFGSCFGIDQHPGFLRSAELPLHMTAPSGRYFCYGDTPPEPVDHAILHWFARRLNRPWLAYSQSALAMHLLDSHQPSANEKDGGRFSPLCLLWADPCGAPFPPRRSWLGRGINPVAAARTSWADRSAAYFAIKGGGHKQNHAHMDAGSFVYESHGVRWAEDPGLHPYALLESMGIDVWNRAPGSSRWRIFRLGPSAHNLLLFGDHPQAFGPSATDLDLIKSDVGWEFHLDLSPLYAGQACAVARAVQLLADGGMNLTDEWEGATPNRVRLQWLTRARVEIHSDFIELHSRGQCLALNFAASEAVVCGVEDVGNLLHPGELPLPEMKRISIEIPQSRQPDGWISLEARVEPSPSTGA